jgi:hypothetical protein
VSVDTCSLAQIKLIDFSKLEENRSIQNYAIIPNLDLARLKLNLLIARCGPRKILVELILKPIRISQFKID